MAKVIKEGYRKKIWQTVKDNGPLMLDLYLKDKYSLNDLAAKFGMSWVPIRKFLLKNGVDLTTRRDTSNKYDINNTYFEKIDSTEKAYFLGWLFSDGCVSASSTTAISILEKDRKVLDLFKKSIGSAAPISIQVRQPGDGFGKIERRMADFRFSDKKMFQDLINLGMTKRKSLTLKFPNIKDEFIPAFLRGYFEGDGTLGIYTNNNSSRMRFAFNFLATKEFGESLIKYFDDKLGLKFWVGQLKSKFSGEFYNMYNFRLYGRPKILRALNHLYKDCGDFYLDRKYNIYQEMLKYWDEIKGQPHIINKEI